VGGEGLETGSLADDAVAGGFVALAAAPRLEKDDRAVEGVEFEAREGAGLERKSKDGGFAADASANEAGLDKKSNGPGLGAD
jgi:hypothetical protein